MNKQQQRQFLMQRVTELSDRLARIRADRERVEAPLAADFAEQAVQTENDEVLDGLDQATAVELHQYEHALARFDAGLHGACERCGGRIEPRRQRALPQATTCIACAEQAVAAA